jgi:hypothetical protein
MARTPDRTSGLPALLLVSTGVVSVSDDHIPQGYIPLWELLDRYIKHKGGEQRDPTAKPRSFAEREKWLTHFEDELAAPFRAGRLTALYRLPGSEENKVVRPEEWNALRMPMPLLGSEKKTRKKTRKRTRKRNKEENKEENKVVRPEEWDLTMPSRPFQAKVLAFPGEKWSKFNGRTLFIEEAAAKQWLDELSGAHLGPKQAALPAHRPRKRREAAKEVLRNLSENEKSQPRKALLKRVNDSLREGHKISEQTLSRALAELKVEAGKTPKGPKHF